MDEEWDEDHALNQVLNEMAEDLAEEIESIESLDLSQRDVETMVAAVENPPAPNEKLTRAADKYKQLQEDDLSDLDVTLLDGLDELEEDETIEQVKSSESIVEPTPAPTEEKKPGLSTQLSQPETRIVDDKRLKKGPLWKYRTNYEDDDKFD